MLRPQLDAVCSRINELAARRQRLWAQPQRITNDRLVALTRELNGHASDLDPHEPSRWKRREGLYAQKRRLLAGSDEGS